MSYIDKKYDRKKSYLKKTILYRGYIVCTDEMREQKDLLISNSDNTLSEQIRAIRKLIPTVDIVEEVLEEEGY